MRDKLKRWELDTAAADRIIARLQKERYIDDARYARAFVKDKIRYNKWGRRKVEQALWQKRIADDIRQQVLGEIDENEYLDVLRPLLKQKRRTTKAENDYALNQKLVRFALGRGFTFDLIRQCLDVNDDDFPDFTDETD
jgi:regulatory protein